MRYYGREVPVGSDEVARLDLSSYGVLESYQCGSMEMIGASAGAYLVVARSYESIVPQITADVGRDDLSVDAIFGNEILIRTSRSCCHCASVVSARHN